MVAIVTLIWEKIHVMNQKVMKIIIQNATYGLYVSICFAIDFDDCTQESAVIIEDSDS